MKCVMDRETHSEEETRAVGNELAQRLPRSGLVLLSGDLGTGKTTLTQGIVEGRGAARAQDVASPTFTLIHEYGDPVSIFHVDLYRLDSAEQVRRLGMDELLDSQALVLVEWGERFPELWPGRRAELRLTHLGRDDRRIELYLSD